MNRPLLFKCALTASVATTIALCLSVCAQAELPNTLQILHGNSRCDHVIAQVLRYGVNNSIDNSNSFSLPQATPFGVAAIPATELGDLQIVSVTQLPCDNSACGPKFAVTVMNESCRKVCNFHLTLVAIFGRITPLSPNTTIEVGAIEPHTALEVVVELPIESLAMGNRNGQVLGFQRLIVAVDSYDELVETNEANNLQALDAGAIVVASTVVQETIVPAVGQATTVLPTDAPATIAPANSAPVGPANTAPIAPEPTQVPDSLDIGDNGPSTEALRTAIEKLGAAPVDSTSPAGTPL